MQIRLHVEADSKIIYGEQRLPVTIATKCSFIPLVKAVTVFIHRSSRYRWIAKVAVPICIGPPAFRHVMPACFKSIVKPSLSRSFIRGSIRR
jgi:hypothetical protein